MRRSGRRGWAVVLAAGLAVLAAFGGAARAEEDDARTKIVVGTKEAPPFSLKAEDGTWQGISIELWNGIATDLGLETTYDERDLDGLLRGVEDGTLDAAVAAITMTPEREKDIDFTHPFFTSGLGIATRGDGDVGWTAILGRVVSSAFLQAVLALAGILALAGFALWFFERKRNREQFGESAAKGLGNAFWWSAVTMTTVGYGDKAPVTLGGRLVALIWMFASIILIAGFTASIASALTVSRLEGSVHGPEDLPGLTVGTVPDTTSDAYLAREGIRRRSYGRVADALDALAKGDIDAVVYDHPLLVWLVSKDEGLQDAVTVLPRTFARQDYGIALPPESPHRELVNQALLARIKAASWNEILNRYLGP